MTQNGCALRRDETLPIPENLREAVSQAVRKELESLGFQRRADEIYTRDLNGHALAWVANMRQRLEDWAQAVETAMWHARRAGHPVLGWFTMMLAVPLALGPRPTSEALATLDAVLADHPYAGGLLLRAMLLAGRADPGISQVPPLEWAVDDSGSAGRRPSRRR